MERILWYIYKGEVEFALIPNFVLVIASETHASDLPMSTLAQGMGVEFQGAAGSSAFYVSMTAVTIPSLTCCMVELQAQMALRWVSFETRHP